MQYSVYAIFHPLSSLGLALNFSQSKESQILSYLYWIVPLLTLFIGIQNSGVAVII